MDKKYKPLFLPIKIGNCEIKNRVFITSMGGTNLINLDGSYNAKLHDYYIDRAKSGVGLILPGMVLIRSGASWTYEHTEVIEPIRKLVDEIHSYGTKIFFQFTAGFGRAMLANPQILGMLEKTGGRQLIDSFYTAADDNAPNVWMPELKMRGITVEEIHGMVDAFAKTALFCQSLGVDGMEVHAVHEGYLLDQFTLKYCNHRTDEYGGSFENRYRFPVEIIKAIREVCPDYPVSLRYSVTSKTKGYNSAAVPGEEFVEGGRDMEESERAIQYLREAGYDMFNCDNGTYDAWYWPHPPVYMPLNTNLDDVKHIKKFTDAPVVCAGRMELDVAAEAIEKGEIDAVGIARQSLCDPEFLIKLKDERTEDIRPCIACHSGCFPAATYKNAGAVFNMQTDEMGRCALNPSTTGYEKKYEIIPAKTPKRIAVIGGGIGGMEFAVQASKRGHQVDLYEKSDKLGGVFIAAAMPDFKEKDKELLNWYRKQLEKSSVIVHMNTEVNDIHSLEADEIVIATGAAPRILNVPGIEKAVEAIDYLLGSKSVGETVAVIGGGLTGCEIAYDLVLKGKHPIIVEMLDDLIKAPGICAANSNLLRDLLRFHKVPVYLESGLAEIKDGAIIIDTKDGKKEIAADSVVTSVGYISGTSLATEESSHVHIIGDAKHVANLKSAIWTANDLVLELS